METIIVLTSPGISPFLRSAVSSTTSFGFVELKQGELGKPTVSDQHGHERNHMERRSAHVVSTVDVRSIREQQLDYIGKAYEHGPVQRGHT